MGRTGVLIPFSPRSGGKVCSPAWVPRGPDHPRGFPALRDARATIAVALVESEAPLCPACAARSVDTPSGLCSVCVVARTAELYAERDRSAVKVRWISWSERTTRPDVEVVKLRQQRSRLRRIVQPHEPATDVDPWQIAAHALSELRQVRSTPQTREHLEAAAESIRRLAWGPDD
jgi:hypothetical protein